MTPLLDSLKRQFDGLDTHAPLHAMRRRAFARFAARGFPTPRDEDWKYTDLSKVVSRDYVVASASDSSTPRIDDLPLAGLDAHRLVFANGVLRAELSTHGSLPAGATLRTIQQTVQTTPELLETRLQRFADRETRVFGALNTAFMQDGAYLKLEANAECDKPILVIFVNTPEAASRVIAPLLIIDAGVNSRASVVECHHGLPDAQNLSTALTVIETQTGANIAHYRIQQDALVATHLANVFLHIGADSEVATWSFAFGAALARIDVEAMLGAPGAAVKMNGLFIAGHDQHIDHHTRIDHQAGRTRSAETYKGIADGNGRGVFNGKIIVQKNAQKIAATQASNNLLLSAAAEIDTKPELEIYADDVSCTHGATVGQLDADSLFYLRARGIPEEPARALLTYAFAQELVDEIPIAEIRTWLATQLTGRTGLSPEALDLG